MLTDKKLIHAIYQCYIADAQCAFFVSDVEMDEIEYYGGTTVLTERFSEIQRTMSVRMAESIKARNRITLADAFEIGIADVPSPLANRLISAKLTKIFGDQVAFCPQFKDGVMQVDNNKDFIFPVRENGLIVRLECRDIPKRKLEKEK